MSAGPFTQRTANKLALLVGSNPLPNYLAAVVLQPREVVLIYSPETREPRDRLSAALREKDGTLAVKDICIDDATDARMIRDGCQDLDIDHLHYSGGTKPMAAHARQVCQLGESQASYLDERKGRLRFDDGYDIRLDQHNLELTLDLLLELHGIERVGSNGNGDGLPTDDDVTAMAQWLLNRPQEAEVLRGALRPDDKERSVTQAKSSPWRPDPNLLSLSVSVVPDNDWTKARYKAWDNFLTGGWLERWTAEQIRACLDGTLPVEVGVRCERQRPSRVEFEIDVALIRGHRLHVISCTTHRKKALCKSKLFEVAMRARQMGGDLARSALVCLLHGSDTEGRAFVELLRGDIASVWDAPNVPRVFGLAHLREWAGTTGDPDLNSLKQWLKSGDEPCRS